MDSIEAERSINEELQTIESQISNRIQRNPDLVVDTQTSIPIVFSHNYKKRNYKQILLQQHEIKSMIQEYKRKKLTLDVLKKDDNDVKKSELESLKDDDKNLKKFDELYQEIRTRGNDEIVEGLEQYYKMKGKEGSILSEFGSSLELAQIFSTGEYFGKYLDLVELHEWWLNLNSDKLNYIRYLEIFYDFSKQSIIDETDIEFSRYLKSLLKYLIEFIKRSMPLFKIDEFIENLETEWKNEKSGDPLYCEACDKTFSKETVFNAHLTGKKHLKNEKNLGSKTNQSNNSKTQTDLLKHEINQIVLKVLNFKRQSTKLNNERKTALTERERQIEIDNYLKEEQESDHDISDDDETAKQSERSGPMPDFKNPMNLPIGPDGQPMPFWLWKLNGLGIEYKCEVCGNFIYKGRKSFENHFGDAKHLYGLKCLGIESTQVSLFKGITEIKEVLKLWEVIRNKQENKGLDKEESVQVEDDKGNVMSEKLYNELKKQGLV